MHTLQMRSTAPSAPSALASGRVPRFARPSGSVLRVMNGTDTHENFSQVDETEILKALRRQQDLLGQVNAGLSFLDLWRLRKVGGVRPRVIREGELTSTLPPDHCYKRNLFYSKRKIDSATIVSRLNAGVRWRTNGWFG